MATGYMGFEEPEVAPRGEPNTNPPSEQTLTNTGQAVEQKETVEAPKPEGKPAPEASPEGKGQDPAPGGEGSEIKEPEPKVVEKIVEKIVEKYPEFKDEDSKVLYEAWVNGEMDKVKAYWREMDKNYDTMSHIDVIREGLSKKHPQWNASDIELELRGEYGKQLEKYNMEDFDKETDPEGYKEALAHNEKADANALKLERDSRDYRITLKEGQKTIELPKIKTDVPPVVAATGPTQAEIDESKRLWADAADKQVSLSDYKFEVGDDKNSEEVIFAVTAEENAARKETMKTWEGSDFMARRGWKNADGSFNLLNIAKDEHTLENVDKMVKSAYTQGVTTGRKAEIAVLKNIDNEKERIDAMPVKAADAGELVWS